MLTSSTLASTSRNIVCRTALSRSSYLPRRLISSARVNQKDADDSNPFSKPAPPPLPPAEQREFEQLVKEKANHLQFNASQQGDELHPQFRAKPKADFEGDVNPKTGESGGPKKEPLTWERE